MSPARYIVFDDDGAWPFSDYKIARDFSRVIGTVVYDRWGMPS